ncbi:MAG TPA: cytochrome d ubiquinol oxidase subunit II, partial [Phormidium sp.]
AILITIATPIFYEYARERLFHQPQIYIFSLIPILGVLLIALLLRSLNRQEERYPFLWTILLFLLSFVGLALVVFPYIIPTEITIYEASADPSSLVVMIIFIGALIPVMLFYNIYQYVVFRGKITDGSSGE